MTETTQSEAQAPRGAQSGSGLGTGPMLILLLAAFTIVIAGLREVSSIVAPVFFALTLALTARPFSEVLQRRGVPRGLSTAAVLIGLYVILLAMFAAVGMALTQLIQKLPEYGDQFNDLWTSIQQLLDRVGIDSSQIEKWRTGFDYTSLVGVAQNLLGTLTSASTLILFIFLSVAFIVMDTSDVTRRAAVLTSTRPALAKALGDFAWRIRRYWLVSAIFGVLCALLDYLALVIIGVPLALTWAVLAFIANFIPNVGFVLAVIPPALLALLDGGPGKMLWVIAAYSVINFITQTLLLPRFMGNAVGLNVTVTFMSLVFWSGIMGPLGALLAVPLTLFVRAVVIESTPRLRWFGVFLGGEQDGGPPGKKSKKPKKSEQPEKSEKPGKPEKSGGPAAEAPAH